MTTDFSPFRQLGSHISFPNTTFSPLPFGASVYKRMEDKSHLVHFLWLQNDTYICWDNIYIPIALCKKIAFYAMITYLPVQCSIPIQYILFLYEQLSHFFLIRGQNFPFSLTFSLNRVQFERTTEILYTTVKINCNTLLHCLHVDIFVIFSFVIHRQPNLSSTNPLYKFNSSHE